MAEAAKQYVFHVRINNRNIDEVSHDGHIRIEDLQNALQDHEEQIQQDFKRLGKNYELKILHTYLTNDIPHYPTPTEFHISELTHVTDIDGFHKICESEGFRAHGKDDDEKFSWWSLKIDEKSIQRAEKRYLNTKFPNRSQKQIKIQEPFLQKFTTSPAFHIDESRYGNFRFSFPLKHLMETYRTQMCEDQEPVLREYKTMFYKQEIMYVVLVHSPENNDKFKEFPTIENSLFVGYEENQIVWKAQAIGDNIKFELILNTEDKIATVEKLGDKYYVWDHVCLAFHFDGVLSFPKETLIKSLTPCKPAAVRIAKGGWCSYEDAQQKINDLQ